jgi:hypothetical protein
MCEFTASYKDSKLLKRRMNKVAEGEEPKLEKVDERPFMTSK